MPWIIFLFTKHDFGDKAFWILQPTIKDVLYLPFILYTGYEPVFATYYHGGRGYTYFHTQLLILISLLITAPLFHTLYQTLKHEKKFHIKNIQPVTIRFYLWAFFPPVLIFIISLIYQPLYLPRYFIFSGVGILFLLVLSLEYVYKHFLQNTTASTLFILIVFATLLTYTDTYNTLNLKYHNKLRIAPLFREIQTMKTPGDIVYLTNELDYYLALYYLNTEKNIYIYDKNYKEIPRYVGKVLIPENVLQSSIPTFPQKAFLIYYNRYEVKSML